MNIEPLKKLYKGFYIPAPTGNNAFSFEIRLNKRIYVAPLVEGTPADLRPGSRIAFSEVEDGVEKNDVGLEKFIYYRHKNTDVFIFDNHNHAFFFWMAAYLQNELQPGAKLIHVDMHSDMYSPSAPFALSLRRDFTLEEVFNYTQRILTVSSFIKPALQMGFFTDVEIIDSTLSFENVIPEHYVLDIDMDIFAKEMDYIGYDVKMDKIRAYIERAEFITIATSPFFMNQEKAIQLVQKFFEHSRIQSDI